MTHQINQTHQARQIFTIHPTAADAGERAALLEKQQYIVGIFSTTLFLTEETTRELIAELAEIQDKLERLGGG